MVGDRAKEGREGATGDVLVERGGKKKREVKGTRKSCWVKRRRKTDLETLSGKGGERYTSLTRGEKGPSKGSSPGP